MFLLLIPWFAEKCRTKKYIRTVLFVSGVFTICVMLSRMVLGMHYATDVITGTMITIFTMQAVDAFIMRQPNEVQRRMLWTRIKWPQY